MRALPLLLFPTVLALCACTAEPAADDATGTSPPVSAAEGDQAAIARAADAAGSGIPQALQGRWGLVPADCEPDRADAKGLLVVAPDSLEFYESVAQLGEATERTGSRIRAGFAFTGEGMDWTREMELATSDGGKTMVRREFGEDAMAGPLEYTRCT